MQYSAVAAAQYEEGGKSLGFKYYFGVAKRRAFYFLVPFVIVAAAGVALTLVQKPIYLSEGKLLVESQEIPIDLVRPTVTDPAEQRLQVIQQRIMTRENLLSIVNKFGLFSNQHWASGTQLLDMMRNATQLQLVEVSHPNNQQNNNVALALTLSFSYEDPQIAARVANEFLTLILNEDARTRTNRASETTKFLDREVKRLDGDLDAIDAHIADLKKRIVVVKTPAGPDPIAAQLTALKTELAQKSTAYSDAHPEVKALKRKVAALEQLMSQTSATQQQDTAAETSIDELQKQRTSIEKSLEAANQKLTAAHLGETLERDQQSERLQVIEQPTVPLKPIKPSKIKLLAMAFGAALAAGFGVAFLAESADRSIHSIDQLAQVFDSRLIVSIPFIQTPADSVRRRRKLILLILVLAVVLFGGGAAIYYFLQSVDTLLEKSWIDLFHAWSDRLTRLSK